MRNGLFYSAGWIFRLGWVALLIIAVLALGKHFVVDILPISGDSMYPNIHDGNAVLTDKISYDFVLPKRGDVVVLKFPGDPDHQQYIKRIIGLPGDTVNIRDGKVKVNGSSLTESYLSSDVLTYPATDITLASDQYYLLGDNRTVSSDSRIWGPASKKDFIGRATIILWPFSQFAIIHQQSY